MNFVCVFCQCCLLFRFLDSQFAFENRPFVSLFVFLTNYHKNYKLSKTNFHKKFESYDIVLT